MISQKLKNKFTISELLRDAVILSLRGAKRRSNLLVYFLMFNFCLAFAQDTSLTRVFNDANDLYKQNKYEEAIVEYDKIIGQGFENGSLYYNLGNCYFKKGELGKAMLNYERAKLFIPHDSDLKSNYDYTRSLLNLGAQEFPGSKFTKWLDRIFEGININLLVVCLSVLYTLIFLILILKLSFYNRGNYIASHPTPLPFGERVKGEGNFLDGRIRFYKFFLGGSIILFVITGIYFIHRLNYLNRSAIIVTKEADAKFEPLESATTYFTLRQGSKIEILESSAEWCKVKRYDGKSGWVKKAGLESIYSPHLNPLP